MTHNESMLKQCRSDIDALREEEKKIIGLIEDGEKKWVVAISGAENRAILNLARLSTVAKDQLMSAIKEDKKWISFEKSGAWGTASWKRDGLKFYNDTLIVF